MMQAIQANETPSPNAVTRAVQKREISDGYLERGSNSRTNTPP